LNLLFACSSPNILEYLSVDFLLTNLPLVDLFPPLLVPFLYSKGPVFESFSTPFVNTFALSEPSFIFFPISSPFPIMILFLNLCETNLNANITSPAINIAMIVRKGPHEAVHLNQPAMSKKNIAIMFSEPVIETKVVMIIDVRIFMKPLFMNGMKSVILNISMKNPIHIPRTIINCCQVDSSSMPKIKFNGTLKIGGIGTSLSKMFSVLSLIPPFSALSFSFACSVMLSSAKTSGLINSNNRINIVSSLFMC